MAKEDRGFASMDRGKQRDIASKRRQVSNLRVGKIRERSGSRCQQQTLGRRKARVHPITAQQGQDLE